MALKIEKDKILFTSGRERYANKGIIGLSPKLTISEGYDGGIMISDEWDESDDDLSRCDLRELADYMIDLWGKFKSQYD